MKLDYTKKFHRQYYKLPVSLQKQFDRRLLLFVKNPAAPQLHVHPLKGKYAGYWSMNISGDFRALYRKSGEDIIIFGLIGSHSQLYG